MIVAVGQPVLVGGHHGHLVLRAHRWAWVNAAWVWVRGVVVVVGQPVLMGATMGTCPTCSQVGVG